MIVYCYFTIYALVFDLTLIALIGVSGASKTTVGFGLKLLAYKRTFSASPTQHNTQQDSIEIKVNLILMIIIV